MEEAIVLSRRAFREYDALISLYTKNNGKKEALARGVKKSTSKNASFLEPFSCVHVGVIPGKEIEHITSVQSLHYFAHIRKDLKKIHQAGFVVGWLQSVLSIGQKDIALYDTLLSWLHFVDQEPETKNILVDALLFKIISFLGFEPRLEACVSCGNSVSSDEKIFFSLTSGGVVCAKDRIEKRDEVYLSLLPSTILSLRYLLNRSWREIYAYDSEHLYESLHAFVYQYIMFCTEKKIIDWKV